MKHELHDAIAQLLATEATFVAEVRALSLGSHTTAVTPGVKRAFSDWRKLGQELLPTWVMEPGDEQTIEQGVGSCHLLQEVETLVALVWHQQVHETAYDQRLALSDCVGRLFLRNPVPGGIADTWLDATGNDRSANHPFHIVTFRLLSQGQLRPNG